MRRQGSPSCRAWQDRRHRPDALRCLETVCTNRIDRPVGSACYTLMLNHEGGVESDLTVFRLDMDHFRLMVGTNAVKRDLSWIRNNCPPGADVTVSDVTSDFAVLGLSGPDSARCDGHRGGMDERNRLFPPS